MSDFNKRITIMAGHYGSGKTMLALNAALELRKKHMKVALADLDIVNPYFRTNDSARMLKEADIRLISSSLAGTNAESAGLPPESRAIIDNTELWSVIDLGGDDRGALAIGRYSSCLKETAEVCFVVNRYRPLTNEPEKAAEIMNEIEKASGLHFTTLINNSNLGAQTSAEDVYSSIEFIRQLSGITGLPLFANAVWDKLTDELERYVENLMPIKIFQKSDWRIYGPIN